MTEAEVLARYNLVIHLVTAADGKEDHYILTNNKARTESPEEAREIDRKTKEAWSTHPNLMIVGNDTLFDEKMVKVGNIIRGFLGDKEVIDKEKYIVDLNTFNLAKLYKLHLIEENIEEFLGDYTDKYNEMYRKTTIGTGDGASYYTYTKISKDQNGNKMTTQRIISEAEYLEHKEKLEDGVKPITKIRYNFIENGERFRLDQYTEDAFDNLVTLERDVSNPSRKRLPEFIKSSTQITNDPDFTDANLFLAVNAKRKEQAQMAKQKKLKLTI